jgi:hypothetical protein
MRPGPGREQRRAPRGRANRQWSRDHVATPTRRWSTSTECAEPVGYVARNDGRSFGPWSGPVRRPVRKRPGLQLTVELDVDPLVEETQHLGHRRHLPPRLHVGPGEVLFEAVAERQGEVRGKALLRASRPRLATDQLRAHVLAREIPTRGQARLEDHPSAHSFRQQDAIEADTHSPRCDKYVDPVIRVAGMNDCRLILLQPPVQSVPPERDQSLQRRCAGRCPTDTPRQRASRNPPRSPSDPPTSRALNRRLGPVLARLEELGAHVLARKHVDRQAAVLVEQRRPPAIDDHLTVPLATYPTRRRLQIEKTLPSRKRPVIDTRRPVPGRPRSERQRHAKNRLTSTATPSPLQRAGTFWEAEPRTRLLRALWRGLRPARPAAERGS